MIERRLEDYRYPVWGTQGGGLAREVNGVFIFIKDPGCPGLGVGDEVPQEWGLQPANQLAREEDQEEPDHLAVADLVDRAFHL